METKPLAAIDIGTNTFRLLVAEVRPTYQENGYDIKDIYSERIITRLGEGLTENSLLKKEAIERGINALKKFCNIIAHYNISNISVVATSALREAKNREEFLKKAKDEIGLEIEIISGEEEARKTLRGMLIGIMPPKTALLVDIGGGSTEFIFMKEWKPILICSLKLGVVYLAEKYMRSDPPLKEDLEQMGQEILQTIMPSAKNLIRLMSKDTAFIGTAGTVTTLSAIAQNLTRFEHNKIHNSRLPIEKIRYIFSIISAIAARERIKYHPFEPERLDIIVPGTLILLKLLETLGFKEIIVSNYGLREGVILELYEKSIRKT